MQFLKRRLPVIIAFCAGMVFWVQYYVPSQASQDLLETFTASWAIILFGAAFILGVLSAIEHHWTKITLKKAGYGYSLVALLVFGTMILSGWFPAQPSIRLGGAAPTLSWGMLAATLCLLIGIVSAVSYLLGGNGERRYSRGMTALVFLILGAVGAFVIQPLASGYMLLWKVSNPAFIGQTIKPDSMFMWFFDHCFVPLDSTMFSLLAFYIASAAFRAFRARSFEATALLISGCLVMIGRVPLGEQLILIPKGVLVSWYTAYLHLVNLPVPPDLATTLADLNITSIAGWILNSPNSAAQRGILLGVILSQVAISLRIMFGIERTYMGGGE